MGDVLSNVIGAPFSQYIIDQLNIRAANGSSVNRSNEQILYLANKLSWTRLTSSVRIKPAKDINGNEQPLSKFYANLFNGEIPPGDYSKDDSLAKNWILQAGTSEYDNGAYNLRFGLGPNSAYGLGGIEQQGYRPMPGLSSVTVESKGTLGSLREANINFSVWNMTQLNVMEALYFRLGYTMLLEWGHVNYFTNKQQFVTEPYGLDIFNYDSKEQIMQAITERNKATDGNYEAMLGTVTNFYFAFNEQGGFDCNVKLLGLGSIIDTLKINQTFIMPSTLFDKVQQAQDIVKADELKKQQDDKIAADIQARIDKGLPGTLPEKPKDVEGIKNIIRSINPDLTDTDFSGANTQLNNASFPSTQYVNGSSSVTAPTATDYYFKAEGVNLNFNNELNDSRTGLFLNKNERRKIWQVIPANVSSTNPVPVLLDGPALQNLSYANRRGAYTPQTVEVSRKQYGATNFFDSAPSDSPAKTHVVGLLDASLKDANFSLLNDNLDWKGNLPVTAPVDSTFVLFVPYQSGIVQKFYAFTVVASGSKFKRQQYIQALDDWFTTSLTVDVTSIEVYDLFGRNDIFVKGNLTNLDINGEKINATFTTNDTGLISKVENRPAKKDEPIPQKGTAVDSQGNTEGDENETNAAQTQQEAKFNSALHAMLVAVGSLGRAAAVGNNQAVIPIDLTETTNIFYQYGVFQNVLTDSQGLNPAQVNFRTPNTEGVGFDLTKYALKGFNSNLMADRTNFNKISDIDWKKLCTAYYVGYEFNSNQSMTTSSSQKPVYIKLGYLLAFLNSMCLLYESVSKSNDAKGNSSNTVKPYVYIDFHPDYNFCLTTPQHMTVDPYKCFIPFAASDDDYKKLFDVDVNTVLGKDIFKPTVNNTLSKTLNAFKTNNAYQGKTMEILLNTQYLLDLANQFATADKHSSIALKPFLDALMEGVNKATGCFNLFRVAYRDDSNTVIIKDDQWTPNLEQETSMLDRQTYLTSKKYMELQIFGSGSLVRNMDFKTNMNTKMSSMIAISAQAGQQYANGVDATPIGVYNANFQDAFMQVKQNASSGSVGNDKATKTQLKEQEKQRQAIINNNNDAAVKFNKYVESVYYDGSIPTEQTSVAVNYYADRLSVIKGTDIATIAAPFIPANLNITIDGISGIVMGNAFGIPENRLPASLRGQAGFSKVGFTVVGLTHTLENNQWLTKIRGQMINLRDKTSSKTTAVSSDTNTFKYLTNTASAIATTDLSSLDFNQDWIGIAFQYISSREGFLPVAKYDQNAYRGGYGSDNFVSAPDANGKSTFSTVTSSTTFTRADAERTLKYNISVTYQKGVINQIGQTKWDSLTKNQKAALLSYAYNAGPGALTTYGIKSAILINAPKEQVAQFIAKGPITIKKGTVVLEGLVTRRKEEAKLYLS